MSSVKEDMPAEEISKEERQKLEAFWDRAKPIIPYLQDADVDELIVDRPGSVTLLKGGKKQFVPDPAISLEFLIAIGKRLANYKQQEFNEKNSSLSTMLPTGERVEMTHPPTCLADERHLNIRKHTGKAFPHSKLILDGYYSKTRHEYSFSLSEADRDKYSKLILPEELEMWNLAQAGKFAEFMQAAVPNYQNIVISGKTFSGKTSYMRSIIEMIDKEDRIVTVEDTHEITLPNHPYHAHLFYKKTKTANGATAKEVLEGIMRKSPDRVLLAELRGDEAMYYLSGVLNSGHPGGMTTTHTGSPKEAFSRLALLILQSEDGKALDIATILNLLYMTVNVVVQLKFDKELGRHIPSIYYDPMHRLSLLG